MREIKKYDYIDAMRGYAVLIVIAGHVAQIFSFQGLFGNLTNKAAMGVQLFYVVSALTLAMSWTSRKDGALNFFIRRIFRIGPLFWTAIIFYLAINGFNGGDAATNGVSWLDVFLTATFTHSLSPNAINSVVPGGWSVACEMTFYLIFPLLMQFIRGWKSAIAFIFFSYYIGKYTSLVLARIYQSSNYSFEILEAWKYYILPSQISSFAIGIALFYAVKYFSDKNKNNIHPYLYFTAATITLIIVFNFLQYGGPIAVLNYSIIFALYIISFSTGNFKAIINKPIIKLGTISYSAYLTHFAVIHFIKLYGLPDMFSTNEKYISFFITFLIALITTTAISSLTYRFIEKPGIKIGNSLINHIKNRENPIKGTQKISS